MLINPTGNSRTVSLITLFSCTVENKFRCSFTPFSNKCSVSNSEFSVIANITYASHSLAFTIYSAHGPGTYPLYMCLFLYTKV